MAAMLDAKPWYHGSLDRGGADRLLIQAGAVEGAFLVRQSPADPSRLVLTACASGRVSHYPIQEAGGQVTLSKTGGGPFFASVPDMIAQLADDALGPPAPLLVPCLREDFGIPDNPFGDAGFGSGALGAGGGVGGGYDGGDLGLDGLNLDGLIGIGGVDEPTFDGADAYDANAYAGEGVEDPFANGAGFDVPVVDETFGAPTLGGPAPAAAAAAGCSPGGGETWECGVCTFDNHAELPECEMCETPRFDSMVPEMPAPAASAGGNDPTRRATVSVSSMAPRAAAGPGRGQSRGAAGPPAAGGPRRNNPFDQLAKGGASAPAGLGPRSATTVGRPMPKAARKTAPARQFRDDGTSLPTLDPLWQQGSQVGKGSVTGIVKTISGTLAQSGKRVATEHEILLCEGPLLKIRGIGQNHKRWFALTNKKLMYFQDNAGELISAADLGDVCAVTDLQGSKRFRITTTKPFGASASNEMLLEAANSNVKRKWMDALAQQDNLIHGFDSNRAELIVEGYLTKVQPMGHMSRTRWFRVSAKKFSYFKTEAGDEMGSVPYEFISNVTLVGKKDFLVSSVQPFTVTGAYEVQCHCKNESVRNKWITGLRRVLPPTKFLIRKSK